ncbi:hypothetical protein DM02DRAFT_16745 [Periconia macrospinosa]|uniref:Uncharacterized protein n=1 Tax=Periconia macrospinosa TaxID=97972 RepID=A0A2V1E756_9PLEO|nr:hypothetical protein DM02DRAFT_16745 [Periconia macrospinosa]
MEHILLETNCHHVVNFTTSTPIFQFLSWKVVSAGKLAKELLSTDAHPWMLDVRGMLVLYTQSFFRLFDPKHLYHHPPISPRWKVALPIVMSLSARGGKGMAIMGITEAIAWFKVYHIIILSVAWFIQMALK